MPGVVFRLGNTKYGHLLLLSWRRASAALHRPRACRITKTEVFAERPQSALPTPPAICMRSYRTFPGAGWGWPHAHSPRIGQGIHGHAPCPLAIEGHVPHAHVRYLEIHQQKCNALFGLSSSDTGVCIPMNPVPTWLVVEILELQEQAGFAPRCPNGHL